MEALHYDERRAELHRMGIEFPQKDKEFRPLLDYLRTLQPSNIVEVGTREGGSLFMLSRVLAPKATIISVDLPGLRWGFANSAEKKKRVADRLAGEGFNVHLVERNSNLPETAAEVARLLGGAPIELLFLDADHSFKGVVADFLNYQPLTQERAPIVFHDIVDMPSTNQVQVHFLWDLLKAFMPHTEFIDHEGRGYGIGLALNVPLPKGTEIRR